MKIKGLQHKRQNNKLRIQDRIKELKREGFALVEKGTSIEGHNVYVLKREQDYLEIVCDGKTILDERVI